jgi:hypothetical protein
MKYLAAVLLLAALATGCGDDSGDTKDKEASGRTTASSTEDFCTAITGFAQAASGDDWSAVQDAADELEAAGLPEDAPAEAGEGYDVVLEVVEKYDSNAEVEKNITDDQDNQVEALLKYTDGACSKPSGEPSESPK